MAQFVQQEINEKESAADEVAALFVEYEKRVQQFEETVCEFPVDTNKIVTDQWKQYRPQIVDHMKRAYPLLHGGVISMAFDFLQIKRKYGSPIEQELYANMSMVDFFDRLATKRAVVFFQNYDSYLLRNGYNDHGKWEHIGTDDENKVSKYDVTPEKKPKLDQYLSYDELIISAMCGVSSPTHFINSGDRQNCGKASADDDYPKEGIYMGLVGARFEKAGVMEYSLMTVSHGQNIAANGFGLMDNAHDDTKEQPEEDDDRQLNLIKEMDAKAFMKEVNASTKIEGSKPIYRAFERFYDRRKGLPLYDEVMEKYDDQNEKIQNRYCAKNKWDKTPYLDLEMFRARMRVSLELFLFDADRRAAECQKSAFCHIVGLGTGVWSFKKSVQDRIISEVTKEIIESTTLSHIACVYFSWMQDCIENVFEADKEMGSCFCVRDPSGHKIIVESGKRAPADPLEKPFNDCLTVAMYAWDSNSFPGNEYYHGMLSASGDPAAASCSTISFVQNSEINKEFINGANTGVYFYDRDKHQYEFYKLKQINFEQNKAKWLRKSLMSIPYKRDLFLRQEVNSKEYVD